ncbi:hypothetical protein JHK82_018246 [Glycine max]|nr:hypothetical protein JHK85_018671 [Glycine max]KAG5037430.1 hypothetical protein JHK86_018270 [Glycine max]KAG5142551.1 hypothetical protein JHK82_018246 [Glycine max]KAH1241538.1 Patatin-like protein 5 [Glycine max]
MSDICLPTSAAVPQLPAYYFKNDDVEFNMVDGGAAAGNPTQVAVSEVTQHNKYTKIQLLSFGTGATKVNESKYAVNQTNGWIDLQRIQPSLELEYDLDPSVDDPTDASKENMDNLEEAGKKMLQENVKRINVDTFDLEETNDGTYAEALDRLANILYEEKELRLKRKSMEKRGRPFIETI